jgi:TP901 family phage tail tape measure protein
MSDNSSSIRTTVLKVKFDKSGQKAVDEATKKLEKLQKALEISMGTVKQSIKQINTVVKDNKKLTEGMSAKNRKPIDAFNAEQLAPFTKALAIARGNVATLQAESQAVIGKIGNLAGKFNDPASVKRVTDSLTKGISQITEKIVSSPAIKRAISQSTRSFLNDEIRRNPNLAKKESKFSDARTSAMSASDLKAQRQATAVYLKGATKANNAANNTGDTAFAKSSARLKGLFENQLAALDKETGSRKAFIAEQKRVFNSPEAKAKRKQDEKVRAANSTSITKTSAVRLAADINAREGKKRVVRGAARLDLGSKSAAQLRRLSRDVSAYEKVVNAQVKNAPEGTQLRSQIDLRKQQISALKEGIVTQRESNAAAKVFYNSEPEKAKRKLSRANSAELKQEVSARSKADSRVSEGARFARGLGDQSINMKSKGELTQIRNNLKEFARTVNQQVKNAPEGSDLRKQIDTQLASIRQSDKRVETQQQKNKAQIDASNSPQFKNDLKFQRDNNTTLLRATENRLAGDRFARAGKEGLNKSLIGLSSSELNELKKSAGDYGKVVKDLVKNSTATSKVFNEATAELKRIERRLEQIKIKQNYRPAQTEIGRAQTSSARSLLAADERRRMDNGAGMFKQQAQLLRNYAVMGTGISLITQSGQFMVQLEKEMKQLQSIVALTNTEMQGLSKTLVEVSEKTKFTALEVTQAAVVLGQAGFGKDQIADSIEGITLFATAVGANLSEAVDLATSTMGIFNRDARDMGNIADKLTTAVNSSKLNLNKLALGLQYAGNIAAQSNVSFEETVAALGAMANSGIRSGSTLGTGLRQILIALQKPSEEFVRTTQLLGLSMSDLDISTNGLIPVLKKLSQSGFTVTDAMRTMQVRAAAAFGAFANNIDVADELAEKMEIGGAAARANAIQMESFANQFARLGSTFFSVTSEAFDPLLKSGTALVSTLADMLSGLKDVGGALSVIGSIAGGAAIGALVVSFGKLAIGLAAGGQAIAAILGIGSAVSGDGDRRPLNSNRLQRDNTRSSLNTARRSAMGTSALTVALRFLAGKVTLVLSAIGALIGGIAYLADSFNDDAKLKDVVDKATAEENDAKSRQIASRDSIKALNKTLQNIATNEVKLSKDTDMLASTIKRVNSEFKALGLYIPDSVKDYKGLFDAVKTFKDEENASLDLALVDGGKASARTSNAIIQEQLPLKGENSAVAIFEKASRKLTGNTGERDRSERGPVGSGRIELGDFTTSLRDTSKIVTGLTQQYNQLAFTDKDGNVDKDKVAEGQSILDKILSVEGNLRDVFIRQGNVQQYATETGLNGDVFKKYGKDFTDALQSIIFAISTSQTGFENNLTNSEANVINRRELTTLGDDAVTGGMLQLEQATKAFTSSISSDYQNVLKLDERDDLKAYTSMGENETTVLAELDRLTNDFKTTLRDRPLTGDELRKVLEAQNVDPLQIQNLLSNPELTSNQVREVLIQSGLDPKNNDNNKIIESTATGNGLSPQELQEAFVSTGFNEVVNAIILSLSVGFKNIATEAKFAKDLDFKNRGAILDARMGTINKELSTSASAERLNVLADEKELLQAQTSALAREKEDFEGRLNDQGPQSKSLSARLTQQDAISSKAETQLIIDKNLFTQKFAKSLDGKNTNLDTKDRDYEETDGLRLIKSFTEAQESKIEKASELAKAEVIALKQTEEVFEARISELQKITTGGDKYTNQFKDASLEEQQLVTQQLIDKREERAKAEIDLTTEAIRARKVLIEYLESLVASNPDLAVDSGIDGSGLNKTIKEQIVKQAQAQKDLADDNKNQSDTNLDNKKTSDELGTIVRDLKANQFDDDVRRRLFAAMTGEGFNPLGDETTDTTYVPKNGQDTPDGILENVAGGFRGINDLLMQSLDNFDPLTEAMKGLNDVAQDLASNFAEAFTAFANGTLSGSEAFKAFTISILESMLDIASEIAANALLKGILQMVAGAGFGGMFGTETGAGIDTGGSSFSRNWNGGEQFAGSYAGGGEITRGMSTRDSTFAKVAKGEFVLRRKAVQSLGIDTVKALNSADPNLIDRQAEKLGGNPMAQQKDTGSKEVNVYVVSPEQMPASLGANDVVHIIADNLTRGGVTKQLVKRINMGTL